MAAAPVEPTSVRAAGVSGVEGVVMRAMEDTMSKEKDVADAVNRLGCAERRLYLARIERDEARRGLTRSKENLRLAKQALREAKSR